MRYSLVENPPFVRVIGAMIPQLFAVQEYFTYRGIDPKFQIDDSPEFLAEFSGRICYRSWHNPRGVERKEYLQQQIVGHGHGSVIEHPVLTFVVADVPRSTQLELVRHRHAGYSWESQRFVDDEIRFVVPPLIRGNAEAVAMFEEHCQENVYQYNYWKRRAAELIDEQRLFSNDRTLRRKRAREMARAKLGNDVASDGTLTMNARALRHVIETRSSEHADASIRELAVALYDQAELYLPAILSDFEKVPTEFGPDELVSRFRKV